MRPLGNQQPPRYYSYQLPNLVHTFRMCGSSTPGSFYLYSLSPRVIIVSVKADLGSVLLHEASSPQRTSGNV